MKLHYQLVFCHYIAVTTAYSAHLHQKIWLLIDTSCNHLIITSRLSKNLRIEIIPNSSSELIPIADSYKPLSEHYYLPTHTAFKASNNTKKTRAMRITQSNLDPRSTHNCRLSSPSSRGLQFGSWQTCLPRDQASARKARSPQISVSPSWPQCE